MITNLKLEIQKSILKCLNLQRSAEEINSKIQKLQEQLEGIQNSLQRETERVRTLGVKQPSRDPAKPDTPQELQAKEQFNQNLKKEKSELIQDCSKKLEEGKKPSKSLEEIIKGFSAD